VRVQRASNGDGPNAAVWRLALDRDTARRGLAASGEDMAQLLVMYKAPRDAAAFDKHYTERHIPIVKKIPGLRKYTISTGPVVTPGAGLSGYHLIAMLQFDDVAAIQKAFASAEGQAAVADVQTFATGGVGIFMFEDRAV